MFVRSFYILTILLQIRKRRCTKQDLAVSSPSRITRNAAKEIVQCFLDEDVNFCKNKPDVNHVKSCVGPLLADGNEIIEAEFNKIFDDLLQSRENARPFQEPLIALMTSHIINGSSIDDLIHRGDEIIKKTMDDNNLTDDNYIDVYCHFATAVAAVRKILDLAQSNLASHKGSYNELKPLVIELPKTEIDIDTIKAKAVATQISLCEAIIKHV
ncbi:hypothetical protein RF11_05844 [Thelohanellus kitauei]|uniref:Uncharacterized protein n=1 Tax=Thelohanellus kitauei TaxID=669202 RepID=A0A0C2M9Z0_THEKT|nr:hypothetical protein RF11_05844 [Thelohanellus kitauei]